jgi:phosphoglycerate dehydrogenase-like enzyme
VPPELFARAKNLRWICAARAGLGGEWFYDALVKSDVVVTNMRGSYNEHLAAHAVAFLLAFARRFDHYLPQKRWQRGPQMIDLPAQTVLIVGVGGAGGEASKLCAAFGMRVMGIDPRVTQAPPGMTELAGPERLGFSARRGGFRYPDDTRNTGNGWLVQYKAVRTDEARFILCQYRPRPLRRD